MIPRPYHQKILLLEDDLKTLVILLNQLANFFVVNKENNEIEKVVFDITVIADSVKAKIMLSCLRDANFDIILLDRDCFSGESFHFRDISKFDPRKVISISAVPEFNKEAKEKYGVERFVEKTQGDLEDFAKGVMCMIEEVITYGRENEQFCR